MAKSLAEQVFSSIEEARKQRKGKKQVVVNIDQGQNARWLAILRNKKKRK